MRSLKLWAMIRMVLIICLTSSVNLTIPWVFPAQVVLASDFWGAAKTYSAGVTLIASAVKENPLVDAFVVGTGLARA
jgi:hypothetical protein